MRLGRRTNPALLVPGLGFEPRLTDPNSAVLFPNEVRKIANRVSVPLDDFAALVPGLGFEPRLTDPNSAVLPLDYPGRQSGKILSQRMQKEQPRCQNKVRYTVSPVVLISL